ncbi:MAG: VIT domain-containing protein [Thermodesulfobacteriota bacterium]|nr:VIT domain-containing protein [Thermodesulfobacteriota bacterium]
MKTAITKIFIAVSIIVCIFTSGAFAAGLLKPVGYSQDSVQMKSHHVDVTINNGFARTQVEQVFVNTSKVDLEAIYSFPLPKQASLSELSLWIDGREVIGEVLEKEKAKKAYEEQKAKGNDTALAEKTDYKSFDVRVYPVRAEDETKIRLVYYQPLEIDLNVGRYVYPLEEGGVDEKRMAFWTVDNTVSQTLSFNLQLKSAFPVKDVRIPHYGDQAVIKKATEENQHETYTVNLDFQEEATLSRDIVFYYRLSDTVPARLELVPYRAGNNEEGTFMAVVTPGASLQKIAEGTDWTFVLDVSGSMGGEKINALVDGVGKVIDNMSYQDRFRIVTFNDKAHDFTGGYIPATAENIGTMQKKIKAVRAGGGTALYAGLKTAYRGLEPERTTGVILVTDGVANIGPSQHSQLVNLLKENDYRLFIFVIGNSANQPLLDALAQNSVGFAMNISSTDDVVGRIIQAKAKVLHECLYDAELNFHGETVKDITPPEVRNLYIGCSKEKRP